MAVVDELPEELMTLILVKLPVKSLLRCKCVKKSWHSLINSPQFIHLHRSSSSSSSSTGSRNYNCFVARRSIKQQQQARFQHALSFFSDETLDDLGNEIKIPFSPIYGDYFGEVMLSCSCDGLVCLTNHSDHILICNPAIREWRSIFIPPSFGSRSRPFPNIESVAFGSDPNTGEYKVVIIGVPYDTRNYHVQVYDFSTDSWRETGVVIPGLFYHSRRAVSLNGAFHWSPMAGSNILTFDISDEVTGSISMPVFVDVHDQKIELFVSSKSQLSIVLYDWGHEEGDDDGMGVDLEGWFEIYVMTEYGVKESWTRLFKIRPMKYFFPLQIWGEHHLLLRTLQGQRQLVSCDLQNGNLRHFPIYGVFDVYPFSESLVSVNGIGK